MGEQADGTIEMVVGSSKRKPSRYHDLSPGLFDIRFSFDLLSDSALEMLDDDEYRVFMRLARHSAASRVWTYSPPGDGTLKLTAANLTRMVGATERRWESIREALIKYGLITVEEGTIRIKDSFVMIDGPGFSRPSMPPSLRLAILNRDQFTCGYCGSKDGPFDVDHIVPLVRGGANTDEDNLICACATCNRSKGGKTVEEWLG